MSRTASIAFLLAAAIVPLCAQNPSRRPAGAQPTLRVTSRAVVLDVIVTGNDGKPVKGLPQSAFTVTEQGKPQTVTFFEEHRGVEPVGPAAAPKLPPNVFSNFSAYPLPPAVNIVLLDSLNTRMSSQSWVRSQALKFLQNDKPGTQTAIFTMGLGFHFIQGFTSDPAVLIASLKSKKNNSVERSPLVAGQEETNSEANLLGMMSAPAGGGGTAASSAAISALAAFLNENHVSQGADRYYLTLDNLQNLATFLSGFPGRKNLIWFAESVPAVFMLGPGGGVEENPSMEDKLKKTMDMLAAARVALYPVDARGLAGNALYEAETVLPSVNEPSQLIGPPAAVAAGGTPGGAFSNSLSLEDQGRNGDQTAMNLLAEQTGGRAFLNTNGIGQVLDDILKSTEDFYTLSYSPTNEKMDGGFRTIDIKVAGGSYKLTYRRGYFALDQGLPGGALETRAQALHEYQQKQGGNVDPLLPFMDLGMPMSDQILYEAKVTPLPPNPAAGDKKALHYGIDFAVDLRDLDLKPAPDGTHHGRLNITLLVYDRYGNIVSHEEHVAALVLKPDVYAAMQNTGLQLHADIATPKGNYWLRTGIYDENSRKVGTLEIPLAAVKPVDVSSQAAEKTRP